MWKPVVRKWLLASSVPPLSRGYRALYNLTAWAVGATLARQGDVAAVYLARGAGRAEVMPGISDLDFRVILRDGSAREAELKAAYSRISRMLPLLDPCLEVYTETDLRLQHQHSYFHQYRFSEGMRTWRLMRGYDALRELPRLSPEELAGGLYTEVKVWWSLYARRFFQDSPYADDQVQARSICYKAISEIVKSAQGLEEGQVLLDRAKALEQARARANGSSGTLTALQASAAARFIRGDEDLPDRATAFLVRYLDVFYGRLGDHRFGQPLPVAGAAVRQRVDYAPAEGQRSDGAQRHIDGLVSQARSEWGERLLGASVVPSFAFNVDAVALMLHVDPARLPTNAQLTALVRRHRTWQAEGEVLLYLRTPNAAFQLDGGVATSSWQSVLCPISNPDVFEFAAREDLTLEGSPLTAPERPAWTPYLDHFFRDEDRLNYDLIHSPQVYKLRALEFIRVFWKTLQFGIGLRSAARGEIRHALTVPAIRRALEEEGHPLPPELEPLATTYDEALDGRPVKLGALYPAAVEYLKAVRG